MNAFAQGAGNSTVTGTVVDTGGVASGASVTLSQDATKVVRTSTSDDTGVFRFAALPPGEYSLKVELQGFKPMAVDYDPFVVVAGPNVLGEDAAVAERAVTRHVECPDVRAGVSFMYSTFSSGEKQRPFG